MKTFIEWIHEHKKTEGSPLAATDQRTTKASRSRDRLIRMEMMLNELISMKQIVGGRKNYAES